MGKVGCDIWEKWVGCGGKTNRPLERRLVASAAREMAVITSGINTRLKPCTAACVRTRMAALASCALGIDSPAMRKIPQGAPQPTVSSGRSGPPRQPNSGPSAASPIAPAMPTRKKRLSKKERTRARAGCRCAPRASPPRSGEARRRTRHSSRVPPCVIRAVCSCGTGVNPTALQSAPSSRTINIEHTILVDVFFSFLMKK